MDPTKLSKNKMLLTGIGEAQVTTIGSFEHKFKIDDENYSLTWHVVPTDKLKFEAVIGSDLLEQVSISFTKEGVKFNKYENHAQLMQISAENLQEELDLRHVENRQIKKELEKLIQDYKPEKTASTDVTMRIILKDEEPVCQPPRRLAFTERQEVNKQIEEWLNEGIIRPSSAEYASPIVMVKKKDGSSRMCIDYRKLNQKLVKDKFPLPIIEDVLDTLQEAKVYSTLDLRNGFFHVDVDEDCRKYTSFIVPDGQFEFNKVPFGLSTSPGVFQRYVSSIFRDLTRKGIVISYLDDLVIPAKNEQEGLEKLKIIFEVAKKYGLESKFKKCQFLKKKIEFLGHIVESGTIKPSPMKTLAVRKFPEPTTIKQVQSFLGLTGYFRNISEDYAKKKELITRIARWALQLEEFDYEIEHRAGSRMKHVDALSRYPVMMVCNDTLTSKLKNAQEEDDNIQTLKSLLEKQESEEFFERNGILYKYLNGRELIVTPKAMQAELIKLIHENGHFSVGKTEEIVKQEFFIPNLSNVVKKESIPLSTYHVDFIGPLPSTNKSYQHIFTVVDAFTKFTWLYPVKTVSAESALEKLKQQQKTFGNPIRIISDRGSAFTSKLFNDYCDEENIQHLQIATGVPRGNGQVERIHRTLIPVLTKLSLDDSTKWYKYVDRLQRILNSTISRSTKWTPFELLVGIKMRNKEDILIKDLLLEEMAKELLEQRVFLRNDAKKEHRNPTV
ncbi:retrovirus-related Pol polyprotein from transposon 17.6 [Trichonephila clavipes]|nr:retrovirus-related Pol polyprotein from transposon 17.6 [Trichonephila clavipes]